MQFFRILSIVGILQTSSFAATIKGIVKDNKTQEDIIGATVFLENTDYITTSDLYGNYVLRNIPAGTYTLVVKYLGYETILYKDINVQGGDTKEINLLLIQSAHHLGQVEVSGKTDKEEDTGARFLEKNASNVINVVSARTIERSPDITVAQVAQRVSGVTLDRSSDGQTQYAIIRGMEQRYNNTLINGIKIPSPDSKNRFIPLDIIPAELLQRLEVAKGLTPEMEGDAIGGSVNAVLKDAPDTLLLKANAAAGYNQINIDRPFASYDRSTLSYKDPDQLHPGYADAYPSTGDDFNRKILDINHGQAAPNLIEGMVIGNRFFNKKIGILLAANNQNTYSGSYSQQNIYNYNQYNQPVTGDLIDRQIYSNANRLGINAKIDYQINHHHKISLYNLYLKTTDAQVRTYSDTANVGLGRSGPGTGYVTNYSRSRYYIQEVQSTSLNGSHTFFNKWNIDWAATYSRATGQLPDMAELSTRHTVLPGGSYQDGQVYLSGIQHTWQENTDRDYSGYLNIEYKRPIRDRLFIFKTGGLIRHKDRDNYQNDYSLSKFRPGEDQIFRSVYDNKVDPYNNRGNPLYNPAAYSATEDITAAYIQGKTNIGALEILGGARWEFTNQSNYYRLKDFPFYEQHFYQYDHFLPSIHLKYAVNTRQNLRFSVYRAISRPNYYELVPYIMLGNAQDQQGNPGLKPTRSVNFDLRYEFYPKPDESLMAGAFYKNMIDPIEQYLSVPATGQPLVTFGNFGTADVFGLEFGITKYLGRFGISGNYTFIYSNISSPKIYFDHHTYQYTQTTDRGDSVTTRDTTTTNTVLQNRLLQGQSKHVANISLLYRDKKNGINIQLSLLIQGNRISNVYYYLNGDWYQKSYYDLSFSADKTIGKHFGVFVKLNNLLNTPNYEGLTSGYAVQNYTFGQNYLLGLKFTL